MLSLTSPLQCPVSSLLTFPISQVILLMMVRPTPFYSLVLFKRGDLVWFKRPILPRSFPAIFRSTFLSCDRQGASDQVDDAFKGRFRPVDGAPASTMSAFLRLPTAPAEIVLSSVSLSRSRLILSARNFTYNVSLPLAELDRRTQHWPFPRSTTEGLSS